MIITVAFSFVVYTEVSRSAKKALLTQKHRIEIDIYDFSVENPMPRRIKYYDIETLDEIKKQTLSLLIAINLFILLASGAFSYFLANQTLKPIEIMVKKQKGFISNSAHELKTPLTVMKSEIEVTLRDKNPTLGVYKDSLKSILEEVDKLHVLTDSLLKQSKLNHNTTITLSKINIASVLNKTLKNLERIANTKNISIKKKLTDKAYIFGDTTTLGEALSNIIENAIKYSYTDSNIEVYLTKTKNTALITIKDFGRGIYKEDLPFIFDPFYRGDKSRTKSSTNGYGLGLSIAKEIIEKHKGIIEVESKESKYTLFKISLPLL